MMRLPDGWMCPRDACADASRLPPVGEAAFTSEGGRGAALPGMIGSRCGAGEEIMRRRQRDPLRRRNKKCGIGHQSAARMGQHLAEGTVKRRILYGCPVMSRMLD